MLKTDLLNDYGSKISAARVQPYDNFRLLLLLLLAPSGLSPESGSRPPMVRCFMTSLGVATLLLSRTCPGPYVELRTDSN